ncbi:CIC11C00000003100 [Sungouiella intermedia]|uniref:2',3'-cyclic-nucleotide 3'-phosphodiesterase n=1 Tax=Sungouiella intermedia TaxID=45354 RepID=A0A1L0GI75_9ASCO|nr:CIC11C00000003100 [[Candida] intermedia]
MASLNTVFPGLPPKFEPHVTITTNIVIDLTNPKDDVDRILSACCIALNSLPRSSSSQHWIQMGKVNSQRKYFKKLYFQVARDPTLVSFARIVRELFVILPQKTEQEHKAKNPHLYHKDHAGNLVRKHKLHSRSASLSKAEPIEVAIDVARIQQELAQEAAEWSVQEFDPHVSLVYSDLHPIDNALWHTIRSRVLDYLSIDNCDLDIWDQTNEGPHWDGGMLKLMLCEGDVNDWAELGSVDLHM